MTESLYNLVLGELGKRSEAARASGTLLAFRQDVARAKVALEGALIVLPASGTSSKPQASQGKQSKQPEQAPPAEAKPDKCSEKQLAAIYSLGEKLGWDRREVDAIVTKDYGVMESEYLTQEDASDFIGRLNTTLRQRQPS